jgi:cell division septation protein DedD
VAELTHDAEDGFHEIQLSGKQLVFLFMATTVVSVVIFLCGVLVGRGVRAERGGDEATVAAAPAVPAPVTSAPATAAAPPASGEAPSPPKEDELSYHKRLQESATPAEKLKKPGEQPAPAPAAAAVENKPAATPPAAAKESAAKEPAAQAPAAPAAASVPTSGRAGNWIIQVHALQNRDAASTFVRRLTSKGYPAFLLNPAPGATQIYRVQIGGYRDRGEAEQVARRLEKEEQFKPAIKRR